MRLLLWLLPLFLLTAGCERWLDRVEYRASGTLCNDPWMSYRADFPDEAAAIAAYLEDLGITFYQVKDPLPGIALPCASCECLSGHIYVVIAPSTEELRLAAAGFRVHE
jgi:hypothetical protein